MEIGELMDKFQNDLNKKKGGFRKIDDGDSKYKECRSPSHNPPRYIYLSGGTYEYTCPECEKVTVVNVPKVTL